MSRRRRAISLSGLSLVGALALALPGCGKAPSTDLTNRLWVSAVPTSPRQATAAFVIVGARGRNIGMLHEGSAYEARHRAFGWAPQGKRGEVAHMTLLQDNSVHEVRVETCKPSLGFDRCVMLHGDPAGAVRYQSRKRWALRGKGSGAAQAPDLRQLLRDLAAEDAALAPLAGVDAPNAPDAPGA